MLRTPDEKYAGWAADAHPDMTQADLRSMATRMLDHGANLLWVAHNNPGEVEIGKWEPALRTKSATSGYSTAMVISVRKSRRRTREISGWHIMRSLWRDLSCRWSHLLEERMSLDPTVHMPSAITSRPLASGIRVDPSATGVSYHVSP